MILQLLEKYESLLGLIILAFKIVSSTVFGFLHVSQGGGKDQLLL